MRIYFKLMLASWTPWQQYFGSLSYIGTHLWCFSITMWMTWFRMDFFLSNLNVGTDLQWEANNNCCLSKRFLSRWKAYSFESLLSWPFAADKQNFWFCKWRQILFCCSSVFRELLYHANLLLYSFLFVRMRLFKYVFLYFFIPHSSKVLLHPWYLFASGIQGSHESFHRAQ